jgi:GTP1/Obg family GTP-binding protein
MDVVKQVIETADYPFHVKGVQVGIKQLSGPLESQSRPSITTTGQWSMF